MRSQQTIAQIKEAVKTKYAWPGGYPMYLIMSDGDALCMSCAHREWRLIYQAWQDNSRDGWKPEGAEINYEDEDLFCCNCGERIESAYGEREEAV